MGIILEEIFHPEIEDVRISVDEDTLYGGQNFIYLDTAFSTIETADDLISLGEWLTDQGRYIKNKYE